MATAPPYDEIDSYKPPVNSGPHNYPKASVGEYYAKMVDLSKTSDGPVNIAAVADAMGISLVEATHHQAYIDDIKREAHAEHLKFEMDIYTNADMPAAALVYHRHLLALALRDKKTPTIKQVADAMGIPLVRATQLQSYLDDIKREAHAEYLKF